MSQPSLSEDIRQLGGEILLTFTRYLRGQLVIAAILAAGHTVAFYLVEMPLWWLGGLLVGFLSLFPYIGFIVGAILIFVIAALGGMTAAGMLKVALVLAAGQIIEAVYLVPKILGRHLSLHPLFVFFAVLAGGLMFGPLGAFLAAPVSAAAFLIWRRKRKPTVYKVPES